MPKLHVRFVTGNLRRVEGCRDTITTSKYIPGKRDLDLRKNERRKNEMCDRYTQNRFGRDYMYNFHIETDTLFDPKTFEDLIKKSLKLSKNTIIQWDRTGKE